jgi:hypothetical protein
MSGYIDAEELVQLLTNLTDELQLKSNLQEITINEAEYFIDSMDADVSFLLFDVFFFFILMLMHRKMFCDLYTIY